MTELFMRILDMSITASWVILAVMAVRLLLRKAPKKYSYVLWAVAVFRLLSPVSIQSVVSAFNLKPFRQAARATGEMQFVPRDITLPPIEIPVADPVATTAPAAITTAPPAVNPAVTNPLPGVTPAVVIDPMQVLITAGMVIWLLGMAVMITVSIINYIRLRKGLRFAIRLEGNIWQCEAVRSPFLVGILRPKIYLPYGLDDKTREYILAHEKYHLIRCDHMAKLLGYAALSIHWFNPLCHLAFRLMNRDMEMSCDEHVLDRNNIPTTQYSYSLLTIATNRRFPAAAPLAFAETGVKERMINVLNWKKPKKWVSVVAVMVCVILLISCATNPKPNGPEVGDASMLEFPGVKWFVTPEELKEALNIKESQIISEEVDSPDADQGWDYDTYTLVVTDLVLYGREVPYANFQFRRDPGFEFEFMLATVMFADDTDMLELKEEMMDLYGPGVGSEYSYYTSMNNSRYDTTSHSRMVQTLEFMAKSYYKRIEGLEGNPFQDALDAPDHFEYQWVKTTGDFIVEDGIGDYFKAIRNTPYNANDAIMQDDEALMAMLNQFPWICMNMGNHVGATILRDATGEVNEVSKYYTNNYMEFDAGMLQGYRHKLEQLRQETYSRLEFSGLEWGMNPEEVRMALSITNDMIIEQKSYDGEWRMVVSGNQYFGADAESVTFRFKKYDNKASLWNVQVTYPTGTDMAVVRDKLIEIYGPGTDYGFTNYEIHNGTVQSYIDWNTLPTETALKSIVFGTSIEDNAKNPNPQDSIYHRWAGRLNGLELYTDAEIERIVTLFETGRGTRADRETALEYLEKKVSITILCRDGYNHHGLEYRPCVSFTGGHIAFNSQAYEAANP